MQPKITIVMPVSRKDYLQQIFAYLELANCDNERTNLLVIVDGDDRTFLDARNRTEMSKFNERLCVKFQDDVGVESISIKDRRTRISSIHNQIKSYIGDCDYVLGIEDDTLIPFNTIEKLVSDYRIFPHAGFIEGLELGRRSTTYVGAWRADDIYNMSSIATLSEEDIQSEFVEIDSGGFYCFITKRDTYVTHNFKPFLDNELGPDVNFGIELRKQGYTNYLDTSLRCIHRSGSRSISYPKNKIQVAEMYRFADRWRHTEKK